MATEQQIADWKARKALGESLQKNRRGLPYHIEVHGPFRDYDYSEFCPHCVNDAEVCAAEWAAEIIDMMDVGDRATVEIRIEAGHAEECHGDVCIHMRKDDDDGN